MITDMHNGLHGKFGELIACLTGDDDELKTDVEIKNYA